MEELEKQVDELLFRTMTLTGQLKQSSESPYSTWTSAAAGANENPSENKLASRVSTLVYSYNQLENFTSSIHACKTKFPTKHGKEKKVRYSLLSGVPEIGDMVHLPRTMVNR